MLSRREFLITGGGGLVTLVLTPLLPACTSSSDGTVSSTNPTLPGCDGAGETSTVVLGHSHTLCVPASDLNAPPAAGATYTTSTADGHTHTVALTPPQLSAVAQGQSVRVTTALGGTSQSGLHSHDFAVEKAAVITPPITSPSPGY